MTDSLFWRLLAVALVVGVFYVADGLHESSSDRLPGIAQQVQAGDVATAVAAGTSRVKIITSSDDGRTINIWSTYTNNNRADFVGSFAAKPAKPE